MASSCDTRPRCRGSREAASKISCGGCDETGRRMAKVNERNELHGTLRGGISCPISLVLVSRAI